MAAQDKIMEVREIENGTVIDHIPPAALFKIITIMGLQFGGYLGGAILTETVFAWPGFGQYLTNALLIGDMNVVVASTLLVGCIFIVINLVSDILYRVFDPRIA